MSEWRTVALGDVADILVGYAFKSSKFVTAPEGVRLLRGANVHQGFTDWGQEARWPSAEAYDSRYELREGDVVLAMDRPWIEAGLKRARLRSSDLPALLVQRVARLRGTERALTSFLHHALATEQFSRYLQVQVTGATVPHISQTQIASYSMRLPPTSEQALICEVLDALDELIENNRRRVEVLEEMARAIYREWFVKFRYPGHGSVPLVDSDLGPIPEGWHWESMADIAHMTMGQSPKSEFYNSSGIGKPFHQGVADFGAHFPSTRKWCSVEGRSASDGDVLVSVRAPVGRINVADTDITIGRGLAALRAKDGRQGLLLGRLREVFAEEDSMGNDGAIYKSLGKAEFSSIPVLVPPQSVADAADEVLAENFAMIRALSGSVRHLSGLRDMLLPKLVTGQIGVSTIDLDGLVSPGSTAGVGVA